jgi:hypothetical protein
MGLITVFASRSMLPWLSVWDSPARAPQMVRISCESELPWLSVQQSPARAPPMIRISVELQRKTVCTTGLYNNHQLERHASRASPMIRISGESGLPWLSVQQALARVPEMIRISVELQEGWLSVQQSSARASHKWSEYLLSCTRDDCLHISHQLERHQWSE